VRCHKIYKFKGLSTAEISAELKSVLGDSAPSDATNYRWIAEFQRGRKSADDEHRSGRPVDVCMDDNVQRVNNLIATDWRMTVRHVAQCLMLSHGTTHQETFVSYQGETTRKVESWSAASP